jgi:predicted amidohydrolase YtcJ
MIGAPPAWQGTARVLLRGGTVYSPADPFATAMLVHGPQVVWVGGDGAALAMADGVDEVVELDGCFVGPAFVDAHSGIGPVAAGVGMAQMISADPEGLRLAVRAADAGPGPLIDPYLSGGTAEEFARAGAADDAAGIVAAVRDAVPMVLVAREPAAVDTAVRALRSARGETGSLRGIRLAALGDVPSALAPELAALGIVLVVRPDSELPPPLAVLAAAGVPLAFAAGGGSPWRTVAAAVNHPVVDQRISGRAAFAAHTRGGWRSAGLPSNGALVPGAPAHYAIWEAGELTVQAPDERIQAWSTDPRSGTPGLPDLSPGAAEPRCVRTVVWGRTISPDR